MEDIRLPEFRFSGFLPGLPPGCFYKEGLQHNRQVCLSCEASKQQCGCITNSVLLACSRMQNGCMKGRGCLHEYIEEYEKGRVLK